MGSQVKVRVVLSKWEGHNNNHHYRYIQAHLDQFSPFSHLCRPSFWGACNCAIPSRWPQFFTPHILSLHSNRRRSKKKHCMFQLYLDRRKDSSDELVPCQLTKDHVYINPPRQVDYWVHNGGSKAVNTARTASALPQPKLDTYICPLG